MQNLRVRLRVVLVVVHRDRVVQRRPVAHLLHLAYVGDPRPRLRGVPMQRPVADNALVCLHFASRVRAVGLEKHPQGVVGDDNFRAVECLPVVDTGLQLRPDTVEIDTVLARLKKRISRHRLPAGDLLEIPLRRPRRLRFTILLEYRVRHFAHLLAEELGSRQPLTAWGYCTAPEELLVWAHNVELLGGRHLPTLRRRCH
mmetsp:Transcript_3911/g.9985  ORF Transcript_3911/g.9985 Transcript_3911/m.9985 type:complete len:200 (+) Transcript_3911:528-1127(+)